MWAIQLARSSNTCRLRATPFVSADASQGIRLATTDPGPLQVNLTKLAGISTAVATLLAAGNAQAAQEIADLAARDNRAPLLALLLTPALGWVAFNILSPALNQLKGMQSANVKRSAAIGLGLGAALLSSQSADAAEEIAQVRLHSIS